MYTNVQMRSLVQEHDIKCRVNERKKLDDDELARITKKCC